jgi:hypothetical protein
MASERKWRWLWFVTLVTLPVAALVLVVGPLLVPVHDVGGWIIGVCMTTVCFLGVLWILVPMAIHVIDMTRRFGDDADETESDT